MADLIFTKHHGLGNDFLVLLDLDDRRPVDEALARAVCDRHRGVGADGVIHVTRAAEGSGADVAMHLRNADGSEAEMSGNGIRCLGQAVVDAGVVAGPDLDVATLAGVRHLRIERTDDPAVVHVAVDMGTAKVIDSSDRRVAVDMGNPHLVLRVDDPYGEDLDALGAEHPDLNVELVAVRPDGGGLEMRVHERGVGETLACGTGACAAATAAQRWGEVGDRVVVHQPGGDAVVDLATDGRVRLTGPSVRICEVRYEWPS